MGGSAGPIACMEDLERVALQLNLAAGCIQDAKALGDQALGGIQAVPTVLFAGLEGFRLGFAQAGQCRVVGSSRHLTPTELAVRSEAIAEAGRFLGPAGIGGLEEELDDLAARLRLASAGYEAADQAAGEKVSAWEALRATIVGSRARLGPLGQLAATQDIVNSALLGLPGYWLENGRLPSLAELLRSHHGDVRALLGSAVLSPLLVPDTPEVARGVTAVTTFFYGDGLSVSVERGRSVADSAPAGVAALADRIGALSASRAEDSTKVAVSRVVALDGQVSWLVTIPGTSHVTLDNGPVPSDMNTNLRAVAGDVNAIGLATLAALRDAGARKGEPVVLAGHSQGGIVSAQLASDPDFNRVFTVAGVLTLGSPVSQMKPGSAQQWLSLEHVQDTIPALAPANERGANHTTVVRDLAEADDPETRQGRDTMPVYHGTGTYAATGAMVDAAPDPSLESWRQAVAPVLDQTATVTTTEYVVKRA
jgi:hypothetical protein